VRCWLFHNFGKWRKYVAVRKVTAAELLMNKIPGEWQITYDTPQEKTYHEDRQERICKKCGYTQDRAISEK